jgi:hypothetical protein
MQDLDDAVFKRFEKRVSSPRLRRYRRATSTKAEAVTLYLWNMALGEALYPLFQTFEVSLRNATHDALSALLATPDGHNPRWFMNHAFLNRRRQQDQVLGAIESLEKKGKGHLIGAPTHPRYPLEPDRVVAELNLGFWISLYSDPFTHTIVQPIAVQVFPNGPKDVRRGRQDLIYPRLHAMLDLRNRVFHHEPIYHWALPSRTESLSQRVESLIEVIGWIDDCQPQFLSEISRFRTIHDTGRQKLLDSAEFTFEIMKDGMQAPATSGTVAMQENGPR